MVPVSSRHGRTSEPTFDDIRNYGRLLGMDVEKDKDLLWIARQGYMAPLPKAWGIFEVETEECGKTGGLRPYYFNHETGESRWVDPIDTQMRELYETETKTRRVKTRRETPAASCILDCHSINAASSKTLKRPVTPPQRRSGSAAGTIQPTRSQPVSPRTTRTFALRAARVKAMQERALTAVQDLSSSLRTPSVSLSSSSLSFPSCRRSSFSPLSTRSSTIKRATSGGRQAAVMGVSPISAKALVASLLFPNCGVSGEGTSTIKATISTSNSTSNAGAETPTRSRGDAGIYCSFSMAALLTDRLNKERREPGGGSQTTSNHVCLTHSTGAGSSSSSSSSSSTKADGISSPNTIEAKGKENRKGRISIKEGRKEEGEGEEVEEGKGDKDSSNTCSHPTRAQMQAQAEVAVIRALLEKTRLASVRLSSESTLLETQLEELKTRGGRLQDALYVAQGWEAEGGRERMKKKEEEEEEEEEEEVRRWDDMELVRAKERAVEERDKLRKDAAMCQSILTASMRSPGGGMTAVLPSSSSSPIYFPVPSTITSFPPFSPSSSPSSPSLSSSSSSSFTAAALSHSPSKCNAW